MSRQRIAFVTETRCYGGVERYLEYLVSKLDLSRAEPAILDFGIDYYTRCINERHGLPVTIRAGLTSKGPFALWSLFRRTAAHVVVFVNGHALRLPWYAALAARLSGARVCAIEQFISDPAPPAISTGRPVIDWLRRIAGWRSRFMLAMRLRGALCDVTICGAESVRQRLIADYQYPPDRTITIPNGIDLQQFSVKNHAATTVRAQLAIGAHEDVLLCVSRIVKRKGIDILLDALSAVSKEHRSWKCIIVGDGPLKAELTQKAADLGLASSVFFVGHKDDVRPYLEAADIFLHPTENDGLPLALLEAMASGLPCIAGMVDGRSEIISDRVDGLLVTPGSVEELTEAIAYLLVDKPQRKRISLNARKRAEAFDIERTMARVKELLVA